MDLFKGKKIFWYMAFLGVYTISPFLLLSQYNNPSADDYLFALRDLNKGFLEKSKYVYFDWSGRYFGTAVSGLNPLNFHSFKAYKIVSFILMMAFVCAVFLLVSQLFKKFLSFKEVLAVSVLIIFLYLVGMPSPAQGFFWFSGYAAYQFPNILCMLAIALINKYPHATTVASKALLLLASAILCVAVIGSNELSLIILCALVFFQCLHTSMQNKQLNKFLLALSLVCLAAATFSIVAPGNFRRLGMIGYSKSIIWTIMGGFSLSAWNFIAWAPTVLIATLFYIWFIGVPFANKVRLQEAAKGITFKTAFFFYWTVFILLHIFLVFVGGGTLYRAENVIYLFFILGWLYNLHLFMVQYSTGWAKPSSIFSKAISIVLIFLFTLNALNINNNISTAYLDLLSGKAKKYDDELAQRNEIIGKCHADSCKVKPLSVVPTTIFFDDINTVSGSILHGGNKVYSTYYGSAFIFTDSVMASPISNVETLRGIGKVIRDRTVFTAK